MKKSSPLLLSKSDSEKAVLKYLLDNIPAKFSNFNPTKLTIREIATNINLSEEDVEEALDNLSDGSSRVKKFRADFEMWLPLDYRADKILKRLYQENLTFYNVYFFSLLFIILFYFLLTFAISKKWILLTTTGEFFFAGVVLMLFAIFVSKKITNKYFFVSEKIRNVYGYQYYFWIFVLFAVFSVYVFITKSVNVVFLYFSLVADITTIIVFFINLYKKIPKKERHTQHG